MKVKRVLKKTGKVLKKVGSGALIGSFVLTAALYGYSNIRAAKYASESQINEVLQYLGVSDEFWVKSHFGHHRLSNNGDEPIYVCFHKDFEDTIYKDYATQGLDYVFGFASQINSDYHYEIVDFDEYNKQKTFGKATIYYDSITLGDIATADVVGAEKSNPNIFDACTIGKSIASNPVISLDIDVLAKLAENELKYVFIHELLHAFALDDIYANLKTSDGKMTSDGQYRIRCDTIMYVKFGKEMPKLTPNDLAILLISCMPKASGEELKLLKQKIKTIVDYYSVVYAEMFDEYAYNKISNFLYANKEVVPPKDLKSVSYHTEKYNSDNQKVSYNYKIDINGKTYKYQIFDESMNLLDSCEGRVFNEEHFIILENCKFENNYTAVHPFFSTIDAGCCESICLFKDGDKILVYNPSYNVYIKSSTTEYYSSNDINLNENIDIEANN